MLQWEWVSMFRNICADSIRQISQTKQEDVEHTSHDHDIRFLKGCPPVDTICKVEIKRAMELLNPQRSVGRDEVCLLFDQCYLGHQENNDFSPGVFLQYNPFDEQDADESLSTSCVKRCDYIAFLSALKNLLLIFSREDGFVDGLYRVVLRDSH